MSCGMIPSGTDPGEDSLGSLWCQPVAVILITGVI